MPANARGASEIWPAYAGEGYERQGDDDRSANPYPTASRAVPSMTDGIMNATATSTREAR
jgi:hypothetical protein